MGTNNVDHASNTKPELARPLQDALGFQAATNPVWDLDDAGCVLTVSANVTEEHNVAAVPVKRAVQNGAKLVVIDPREVELTRYATVWVRPRPGTEATLIGGMLRVISDEVLEDQEFIRDRCENLDGLKNSLWRFDLSRVEVVTGVPQEEIRTAARTFAGNGPAAILYALDTVPASEREACVEAIVDLALLTGNVGKPHSGLYPLRPGTNDQGSWDVGCVPDLLPGYLPVADADARSVISETWGSELPSGAGMGVLDAFEAAADGRVKAMMVIGDSASYHSGELGDVLAAAGNLEFLVVQDAFLTGLAQAADVVLPSATFAEKEGTYTSLERRVQPLRKVLEVRNSNAMPDWWIVREIAKAMNAQGFDYHCPAQILDEISRVVPLYAGVSYQRLLAKESVLQPAAMPAYPLPSQLLPATGGQNAGVQWPCESTDDDGTTILYSEEFQGGKAHFIPLELREAPALPTTDDFPLLLLPGRVLHQSEREMEITLVGQKNRIQREETLCINPSDASALNVAEGDMVEVISARDSVRARAALDERSLPGTVSVTFLFGELMTQLESSEDPDAMSHVPGLPLTPVRLAKA